jgi:leucyl-tRNA synthetase
MSEYNFKEIERKWQDIWEKNNIFSVTEDKSRKEKKYYVLEMFPYPSGRLHMGHVRNYTIGDVIARFKRMKGFYVMHPIGWDSFGLPAENAAIKSKKHPQDWTLSNIGYMKDQLKKMGFSYDWSREITTCKKDYYKWNQWLFLKFYDEGLVYKKKSTVNWCSTCNTVLANEQVEEGKCWRCDNEVSQKELEQWFFKITDYKEALLKDHELISSGWAPRIISMQKNWIGESIGTEINFLTKDLNENIKVFTTRADTLLGVTYIVLAPEHPLIDKLIQGKPDEKNVKSFIDKIKNQSEMQRKTIAKEGIFTGSFAIHPVTGEQIPIWIGNYVIFEYGSGAVMAVPAHDSRDYEFAKKYKLPIKIVIKPVDNKKLEQNTAFEDMGVLINSREFDNLSSQDAKNKITEYLKKNNKGDFKKNYKLKDWLISRQRYWGTPIPIVYCEKCGIVKVEEKSLPVELPSDVEFTGAGDSPLKTSESFIETKCPKCGGRASRETDTMDTFVDSSWYFLRYCDPKNNDVPFQKDKASFWMPVDQYVGGAEHACMHLLYSRFFVKVLKDLGFLDKNLVEPFTNLLNQGMVIKDGAKMSKSKGNIVDPDDMLEKYGTDALRLFILFASPPTKDLEWNEEGIEGSKRFLMRLYRLAEEIVDKEKNIGENSDSNFDEEIDYMVNKTIKDMSNDLDIFSYNTSVARVMEAVNFLYKKKDNANIKQIRQFVEALVIMLNPFVPHITEELWSRFGNKKMLVDISWPLYDESKTCEKNVVLVVQINGKLRGKVSVARGSGQDKVEEQMNKDEKILEYLKDKQIIKKIFVQDKLINIVIKS